PDFAIAARAILQVPDNPKLVLAADQLLERGNRTAAARSCFHHVVTFPERRLAAARLQQKCPYYHFCPYLRICIQQYQIDADTDKRGAKERQMKYSMIKYQFANGATDDWHREVARFIAAIDGDPELKGKISYRVMKNRDDSSYSHLAGAADDAAVKTLQS